MSLKTKMTSGSSYIDPDTYAAMLVNGKYIAAEKSKYPEYGDNFLWTFRVKDPRKDDEIITERVELTYYTPAKLTAKNKLGKLLAAAGVDVEEIDEGDEVDLEELLLKKGFKILVEDNAKEEGTFSKITKILPLRKKKAKAKVEVEEEEEDEAPPKKAPKSKKKEETEDSDVFDMDLDDLE